ncbi:MAG TPA: GNAT family N-acetyltransferase [Candidatus Saccharimonadales bacterium]|nr:GNAT family N-acetyltransferase [Candidatus Saccharimonadales bacterium]
MLSKTEKLEQLSKVDVLPAMPLNAKRIWTITKAGKIASMQYAAPELTGAEIFSYICGDGPIYEQIDNWEAEIVNSGPTHQVLVAKQKQKGSVQGVVVPRIIDGERYITNLYVAKAAQGLGIGPMLLQAGMAWHHYEPMSLTVTANNPAQHMYADHAFSVVEQFPSHAINGKIVERQKMQFAGLAALSENWAQRDELGC